MTKDFHFETFPIITTPNFILREITLDDVQDIFTLRSNRDVLKHIGKEPMQLMDEAVDMINRMHDAYQKSEGISWGMQLKGEKGIIGSIGLWRIVREHHYAEIGYSTMTGHWGKGYISECIPFCVNFGFDILHLHRIEAQTSDTNFASMKALQKNGFIHEGTLRENYYFRGEYQNSVRFSILTHERK